MHTSNQDPLPDFEQHRDVLKGKLEAWYQETANKFALGDEPTMEPAREHVLLFAEHTGVLARMPLREGQQLLMRWATDLAYLHEAHDLDDFRNCFTQCFHLH